MAKHLRKSTRTKITSSFLLGTMVLSIATPSFAQETTKVIGTFEATILDVSVPATSTFIYNPNTEQMTTQNLDVVSNTNAPIYMNMEEINVSEESSWKPNLIAPATYTSEQWRNLTTDKTSKEVALGVHALDGENWLFDIENPTIWSSETVSKNKVGTLKNHGIVEVQPVLKSGNAIPSQNILTTNYIFEFGLEEGKHDDSDKFTVDINKDLQVQSNGIVAFEPGTWQVVGSSPKYLSSEGAFHVAGASLSYYQYNLPVLDTATFELKAKTLSNVANLNSSMSIETGGTGVRMYFYPDKIEVGNITHYLTGNEYHTYRIVKEGAIATIYVDGEYIGETPATINYGYYRFFFGDGTSGGSSDAYFKDIRIAPGEALHL
ncbi:hypothetical protein CVD28_02465 [Bacillus sp. M6-12]|uniref:hypothetical protein n=1 Tax=Bacillus sp. M6-12 TaxID=2054166 RepID=UPI000C76D48C|nr:hypothetical protein [Bacillus sp. M6-12]PLS19296.1 hypothetical protein CVD28_02465 [Bacillus sp. M6-12]